MNYNTRFLLVAHVAAHTSHVHTRRAYLCWKYTRAPNLDIHVVYRRVKDLYRRGKMRFLYSNFGFLMSNRIIGARRNFVRCCHLVWQNPLCAQRGTESYGNSEQTRRNENCIRSSINNVVKKRVATCGDERCTCGDEWKRSDWSCDECSKNDEIAFETTGIATEMSYELMNLGYWCFLFWRNDMWSCFRPSKSLI